MLMETLGKAVIDIDTKDSLSRIHRSIFSDPAIFELEMRLLFEGGWVFLALENQIPNAHDYMLTHIGRHEILLMRNQHGEIGAFHNTCPHRGARICNLGTGNSRLHVCPYHSWSFDSSGNNSAIKSKSKGGYSDAFLAQNHDLYRIARLDSYRGMLFGSLVEDVPDLKDYLGEITKLIDLTLDQSEDGAELLPGCITYTYRANWKLQLENGSDGYHVTSTHPSYLRIAADRAKEGVEAGGVEGVWERSKVLSEEFAEGWVSGSYCFDNGHALAWAQAPVNPAHPLYERREELEKRVGAARMGWMFGNRNLTIFPNVQLAENFSNILRIIRPITPELTEMKTYCMAPIGESADARRQRLRQYEDFFNPSGLATPDDVVAYEGCQKEHGLRGPKGWLQGYERGLSLMKPGPDEPARSIGLNPAYSTTGDAQVSDEMAFLSYYRAWNDRLGEHVEKLPALEVETAA